MAQFTADIAGALNRGLQFRQENELRPAQLALANQNVANAEQGFRAGEQNMQFNRTQDRALNQQIDQRTDEQKSRSLYNTAFRLENAPDEDIIPILEEQIANVANLKGDSAESQKGLELARAGDFEGVRQGARNILDIGVRQGDLPSRGGQVSAEQQTFDNLIKDFSPEDQTRAKRVKAGLDERAVGSAIQTIAKTGTATNIADVESVLASAKETGKLTAQLNLRPEVESAVIMATGQARLEVDKIGKNRSNQKTLNVYTSAMSDLTKALDDTITGPFVGLTPGLTANAQIADGAVAMMLPLMKDVFRGAGEGTFTEGDQKILTNLIPTRSTLPEARIAQIQMIDTMIRAKLSAEPTVSNEPLTQDEQSELEALRMELGL
jgi:hypothetical protein